MFKGLVLVWVIVLGLLPAAAAGCGCDTPFPDFAKGGGADASVDAAEDAE